MEETDLQRAQKALAIHDVYVCEASAWADRAYDPTIPIPQPIGIQFRVGQEGEAQVSTGDVDVGGQASHFVRYFVATGLRVLRAGVDPSNPEIKRQDLLSEVTAIFVLRYAWLDKGTAPMTNLLAAFSDNAVHHMWPYWREFLQASTGRLRLPPIMLPMRAVTPPIASPTEDSSPGNIERAEPVGDDS